MAHNMRVSLNVTSLTLYLILKTACIQNVNGQILWKTVWTFFKNSEIKLPYDPKILLLGIYLKGMKTLT